MLGTQPWRPKNETAADLAAELDAAKIISERWKVEVTKLSPVLYGVDWCLSRDGQVRAFAEFKVRDKRYDTLLLSFAKVHRGLNLAGMGSVRFVVFVRWPDGLYWVDDLNIDPSRLRIGGNSRGQNGDVEPCVHIDSDAFRKISD